jgi:lipopolysaccharide transport system ATP-binding protein
MSRPAITIENLSKRYILGKKRGQREGLRHALEEILRRPFASLRDAFQGAGREAEEFWALQDVSFSVKEGDVVAVIGRNGAGKSTLLKILSRITEPTSGRITIHGRVASLLEVGTGFHQELTGRENIFLNGAILGMTRGEIRRKFDEIVAFSEVEKFLDTPVKRYSSGMYVRLAFAVAAHLEPEILIVDEVLAVGDSAFQKKCLGKMGEVAESGRTVLFVSHNMGAVQALCRNAIYLKGGRLRNLGPIGPIVQQYLEESGGSRTHGLGGAVKFGEALQLQSFQFTPNPVVTTSGVRFRLRFAVKKTVTVRFLSVLIDSAHSARVALVDLRCLQFPITLDADSDWMVEGTIRSFPLVEGDYSIGLTIDTGDFFENVTDLTTLTVGPGAPVPGQMPIPVMYRGMVELNVEASETSTVQSAT